MDVLWWGAESKTQVKMLREVIKKVDDKTRGATEVQEVTALTSVIKKVTAIAEVVDVASQHGLEGEDFQRVYDLQCTSLALPPEVAVDWPPHVLWSRHKMDIGETETHDRWMDRVSSSALTRHGVANVLHEQDFLLAERLAGVLKGSDFNEVEKHCRVFFSPERDFSVFEDFVQELATAISVVLWRHTYENLEERVLYVWGWVCWFYLLDARFVFFVWFV